MGISSYNTNNIKKETNTDFWNNQLKEREEETAKAKQKWENASSLWNRLWGEMQGNWTNLISAKNIFGKYYNDKMSYESLKNNLIKEMNWEVKVAEDNAREKALSEGKTPEEAEKIAKNAGEDVKNSYMQKISNASFEYEKFMPTFKEKQANCDNAQEVYAKSQSDVNGAEFDSFFYGRQFADASSMELKAKQNLTLAEHITGQNMDFLG